MIVKKETKKKVKKKVVKKVKKEVIEKKIVRMIIVICCNYELSWCVFINYLYRKVGINSFYKSTFT